jgi:dephospho-CoA kinase
MQHPFLVGITGGIGSGKSTLSKLLRKEGYFVYDSDKEARKLQNENQDIRQKIQKLFGNDIYNSEGLNRKEVAKIVFNDKRMLAQLNTIIHPEVRTDFNRWVSNHDDEKILFLESAILFENGFNQLVDKVIVITANEELRILRVVKRDKVSPEQVLARIANQLPEETKVKRANFVIHTDDNRPLLEKMKLIIQQLELQ